MLKYYVADAFADTVFEGNPAGVCILDTWLEDETMRKIAMENNLSETGFAVKIKDTPCTYELRWFTPKDEIDLCGHCTLGTAYILFRFYETEETEICFHALKCGHVLNVKKDGELLTMDFPAVPPVPYEYADYMGEALGYEPAQVLRTERDLMLVYDDAEVIRNMEPDFEKIRRFPIGLSVYVTAKSDDPAYDIVCRAFWPKLGINEDPVCGSMHTTLVPYWSEVCGKRDIVSREVSPRGGTLYCTMEGDRVSISGRCVLYLTGEISVE
ncbi:MAG: PhzF family phenazine biosynthesis protein [Solobacterium sp.]|nr:PhzF family phenazine biosynthesis protein [Solobacterium sp.]